MFNVGPLELMVILIVALLVVGPSRLPEVGRSIGRGLREFRKAQDEMRSTIQTALAEEPETSNVNIPAVPSEGRSEEVETSAGGEPAVPAEGPELEPAAGSEAVDMARTIGRGLAELRRARDEIQRTFKVDLSDVTAAPKISRPIAPKAAATRDSSPEPKAVDPTVPEEPPATE